MWEPSVLSLSLNPEPLHCSAWGFLALLCFGVGALPHRNHQRSLRASIRSDASGEPGIIERASGSVSDRLPWTSATFAAKISLQIRSVHAPRCRRQALRRGAPQLVVQVEQRGSLGRVSRSVPFESCVNFCAVPGTATRSVLPITGREPCPHGRRRSTSTSTVQRVPRVRGRPREREFGRRRYPYGAARKPSSVQLP